MIRARMLTVAALLYLTGILFAAACVSGMDPTGGITRGPALSGAAVLLAAAGLAAYLLHESRTQRRIALQTLLLCAAFFAGGVLRTSQIQNERSMALTSYQQSPQLQLQGQVTAQQKTDEYCSYTVSSVHTEQSTHSLGCVKIYFRQDQVPEIPLGSFVSLEGRVTFPDAARNEGGFDLRAYEYSRRIYGHMSDPKIEVLRRPGFGLRAALSALRSRMTDTFAKYLPGEESGILAAIALGDRSGMDEEAKSIFTLAGLAHILAISGMHISVVGLGIFRKLRKWHVPLVPASLAAGAVLVGYCILTGSSISAKRATIMYLMSMLAGMLGEAYDSLSGLSLAALVLLAANPMSLWDPGFEFSFVAVGGVILVALPLQERYRSFCIARWSAGRMAPGAEPDGPTRWKPTLRESLGSTLIFSAGVQLATIPMAARMYYEVPVYVILLNLIVLPMLSWLLGFGLLGGLAGACGIAPHITLGICHVILYLSEWLADFSLRLPASRIITGKPPLGLMAAFYLILLTFVHGVKAGWSVTRPGRKRMGLVSAALTAALILTLHVPMAHPAELTMLDVGQGDGLYLCDGEGRSFMIDGGSTTDDTVGERRILPFLRSRGITEIDTWFITHTDLDHYSGLIEVLSSGYPVKRIVFSAPMEEMCRRTTKVTEPGMPDAYDEIANAARAHGTRVEVMSRGDVAAEGKIFSSAGYRAQCEKSGLPEDEMHFICLYPGKTANIEGTNENCLVLLMRCEGLSAFLGGDIGAEQERQIAAEHAGGFFEGEELTIMKADHHGSNYSNNEPLLKKVSPDLVFISAGRYNRYGHPGKDALKRFRQYAGESECTMNRGQITLRREKGTWKLYTRF